MIAVALFLATQGTLMTANQAYRAAAELISAPEADDLINFVEYVPPAKDPELEKELAQFPELAPLPPTAFQLSLRDKSVLWAANEAARRYQRAADLVHAGRSLPWALAPVTGDPGIIFPDLADNKRLAKLLIAIARSQFAAGRSDLGTQTLLDLLIMADNIGRGLLIDSLVGVAVNAIALAAFEQHLDRLSDADWANVQGALALLSQRPPMHAVSMEREIEFSRKLFEAQFSDISKAFEPSDEIDEEDIDPKDRARQQEMLMRAKKLTPSEAELLKSRFLEAMRQLSVTTAQTFTRPEREWKMSEPEFDEPLLAYLAESLFPIHGAALPAYAKYTTQRRLLGLHAEVQRHRWKYGTLPSSLKNADDPLNGTSFTYQPSGETYELYSQGNGEVGPIALRYRRAPGDAPGKVIDP